GDAVGFKVGLGQLENFALDFNPLTDLSPLKPLTELRRLSFDGGQNGSLDQVADLNFPVPGGGKRGLELLSLDNFADTGLQGQYFISPGVLNSVTAFDQTVLVTEGRLRFPVPKFTATPEFPQQIGPAHMRTDATVDFALAAADFAGFADLDDN